MSSGTASTTVDATAKVAAVVAAAPSASSVTITQHTRPSQSRLRPEPGHTGTVSAPTLESSSLVDATAVAKPSSRSARPGTARWLPGTNGAATASTTGTASSTSTVMGTARSGT